MTPKKDEVKKDEQPQAQQKALATTTRPATGLDAVKVYSRMPEVKERFFDLLGEREGKYYIGTVITIVSNSDDLMKCTPKSIMISALRSAALRLSVDPLMKQAHLVPRGGVCTMVVDYHGYVMMMDNTGNYKHINVFEVWPGEVVVKDRFTGDIKIEGQATSYKEGDEIGWCAYTQEKDGRERFLFMTNQEIIDHAMTYNPGGYSNPKGIWQGKSRRDMFRKTPLRLLAVRWGKFRPHDAAWLKADEVNGLLPELPDDTNLTIDNKPRMTPEKMQQNMDELGVGNGDSHTDLPKAEHIDTPEEIAAHLANQ